MSTFDGFFKEIPFISADCFKEQNILQSKIFFLSHCHADHMEGLSSAFDLKVPLYTSEISALFLRKQYSHLRNIEILTCGIATQLAYNTEDGEEMQLLVTAIPAHHCPGSVMFLFQTHTRTILYTGDFRILKSKFKHFPMLTAQPIDKIYLDSTFLKKEFMEFPTQIESSIAVCDLVNEWLEANLENQVVIEMPGQYGIEFLFINIGRRLKRKIYVDPKQWDKYSHLPDMDTCISLSKNECRIESKFKGFSETTRRHVRIIMPTALWWKGWHKGQLITKEVSTNKFRVAYSSHCSCAELKDFLEFVQPTEVCFNVVSPPGSEQELRNCLSSIYPSKSDGSICMESKTFDESVSGFKFDKIQRIILDNCENDNCFKSDKLHLPPKRLKK